MCRHRWLPANQKRNGTRTEQFFERPNAGFGQNVEPAAAQEEAVSDKRMQVRMEIEVFAEGVDDHYRSKNTPGQLQNGALVVDQAVAGNSAEIF